MPTPILSVLVDTFNHERYVEQAVTSVLEQDFPAADFEILVVDDGSTDRTPEIVRRFAPRVRLVQKKNGGQASAFNAGIPETRGEIVAFLDGDDWFAPGKLTAAMNELNKNRELSTVAHGRYYFNDRDGGVMAHSPTEKTIVKLATPKAARDVSRLWEFFVTSAMTVRRGLLERILPIPPALTFCADGPIALASMAAGACILNEPLSYYRLHSSNLCTVVGVEDAARAQRGLEMSELAFTMVGSLLPKLGVPKAVTRAFARPPWLVEAARRNLAVSGGSRLKALQTEMASFHWECENPSIGYRLFKCTVVGAATLLLPAKKFYKAREWYGRRNLGRLREQFVRAR